MNNNLHRITAIVIAIHMLFSLSACSIQESGNTIPATTSKASEYSETIGITENTSESESVESKYTKGIELLRMGRFSEAQALFEACGNYEYALDLVNVCKAENEFSRGNFNSAVALYSKVSERTDVPGFQVQRKKATISTRVSLVKMSGTYYPTSNKITMKKYKKKRKIGGWHSIGIWSPQYVTLSYTENSNGTFNVSGYVQFMRYTKYAKKKSGLKTGVYKLPINLKNVTRFPNKLKLAKGVTLTYKNGSFVVNYSKTAKSGKTKVVYKSVVTYRK